MKACVLGCDLRGMALQYSQGFLASCLYTPSLLPSKLCLLVAPMLRFIEHSSLQTR